MLTLPIGADLALARLGAAILLSLIFGLVRQRSGKPIGFGTFTFVSVGACALALVAVRLAPDAPLALLGAIVTGIGFLGAGALVRSSAPERISGFTSAATIWIVAVFGLTIGVGEYLLAALLYAAIWLVTSIDLPRLSHRLKRRDGPDLRPTQLSVERSLRSPNSGANQRRMSRLKTIRTMASSKRR